jgi:PAS domain S-box-containing protein
METLPPNAPQPVSPGLVQAVLALATLLLLAAAYWLATLPEAYWAALPLLALVGLGVLAGHVLPRWRQLVAWEQAQRAKLAAERDQQLAEAHGRYQQLAQQRQQLATTLEAEQRESAARAATIASLRQANADLEQAGAGLTADLATARAHGGELEQQLAGGRATAAQLTTDLAAERATTAQLRASLDASQQALFTMTKRHQSFLQSVQFGLARFEVSPPVSIHHEPEKQIRELYQHARLVEANQPLAAMSGYGSPTGMTDMKFGDLFKNPQGKHAMSQMRQMVQNGHSFTDEDSLEADSGDRLVRYQKNYACVIDNGFVTDVWYAKTNVSNLKDELAGAVANERFYQMLLANQSGPVAALDENGNIKFLSEAFARQFGHQLASCRHKAFISLFPPDEAGPVLKALNAVFGHPDEPAQAVARIRVAGGGERETELTVSNCMAEETVGALVVSVQDVTTRNQERRAAAARQQFLAQVLDAVPHPVLVTGPGPEPYLANRSGQQLLGSTPLAQLLDNLANGAATGYEQAQAPVGLDEGGEGTAIFLRDVLEERRNWRNLQLEKDKWQALALHRGEAVAVVSTAGELRVAPSPLMAQWGLPTNPGQNFCQWFDPAGQAAFGQALKAFGQPVAVDFYLHVPGREPQWIEAVFTNLADVEAVGGVVVALRERTPAKAHLDDLTRREHQFRQLCTHALPPLALASEAGEVLWAHPHTKKLFGWQAGQGLAEGDWLRGHEAGLAQLLLGDAAEFSVEAGPVAERYLLTCTRVAGDAGEPLVVVTGRPLTELLALSQQLAEAGQALEQQIAEKFARLADKDQDIGTLETELAMLKQKLMDSDKVASVGRLAAGIAHHLHQPVMASLGRLPVVQDDVADLQALIDRYAELNPEIDFVAKWHELAAFREILGVENLYQDLQGQFASLRAELGQVAQLSERLAHFAKPTDQAPTTVDLNQLVREVLDLMAHKVPSGVEVATELGDQVTLQAKPGQLAQLLMNLVDNALDALRDLPTGTVPRLTIQTKRTTAGLLVKVIDNGRGIRPGEMPRLFTPFFTTKEPSLHLGLGLYVAKEIAELYRGRIEARAQAGEDTTLAVYLDQPS